MQHLEISGAVRPLKWSLGVKWLISWNPLDHPRPVTGLLYLFYSTSLGESFLYLCSVQHYLLHVKDIIIYLIRRKVRKCCNQVCECM